MRKKRIVPVIVIVALALAVFGTEKLIIGRRASASVAPGDENKASEACEKWIDEYKAILVSTKERFADSSQLCSYTIYDINEDGYPELLVKTGHCEADIIYEAYTFENGKAVSCGQFSGEHTTLCGLNGENGIITQRGQMDYEVIDVIKLNDTTISQPNNVFKGKVKEYHSFTDLQQSKLEDFSGLRWKGNPSDNNQKILKSLK